MIADHDGNVIPRGGAPVWIVITLLRYFQAPPRTCWILPRVDWQITFEFLISSKQTCSQLKNFQLMEISITEAHELRHKDPTQRVKFRCEISGFDACLRIKRISCGANKS